MHSDCPTHARPSKVHRVACWAGQGVLTPSPAVLNTLLELLLGHGRPVHLVGAGSKAQCSGPGEKLHQWVVTAQPCCSEGLADRAGGEEPGVNLIGKGPPALPGTRPVQNGSEQLSFQGGPQLV